MGGARAKKGLLMAKHPELNLVGGRPVVDGVASWISARDATYNLGARATIKLVACGKTFYLIVYIMSTRLVESRQRAPPATRRPAPGRPVGCGRTVRTRSAQDKRRANVR